MTIAIGILIFMVCFLAMYIALLQWQLRSINQQLHKRLTENTRQPVSLELINRELNQLSANINKCLKAEEALRHESVREEKNNKELIANISHDLRTPLTAIKGYQQLIEKGELTVDQRKKLHIAQKYAEELGRLIEHLFAFSYLANAEMELNVNRINLTNLVTECLATFVSSFEERGIMVHVKQAPQVFALADQEMTVRIVQNIIRNCVDHSAGDVVVVLEAFENAVMSFKNSVRDADEIDVKRMFDRFYTGDPARRKTTGLGLSIVKLLTEQMGGAVTASLQKNEFGLQVKLPLSR